MVKRVFSRGVLRESSKTANKGISLLSKLAGLSKIKSILQIAGSLVLIGGVATWSLFQKEDGAEKYIKPETSQTIFQENTELTMTYEDGETVNENLEMQVNLDEDNTLHLGIYTQNYNNTNWGKSEIALKKFTTINNGWSRVYVVRPREVKVSDNEQIAYTVPNHKWIELIPSDEDPLTKIVNEQGKTLVCESTGLIIPVPFAGEVLGKFIDDSREAKEKLKNTDLEKIIHSGYIVTKIPSQTTRNLSSNITAKEYTLSFDTSSFREGEKIPAYLWVRTALGDPSVSASGSAPNRYGLEEKVIEFDLTAKKAELKKEEIKKETDITGKGYEPLVGAWMKIQDNRAERTIKQDIGEILFFSQEGWGAVCTTYSEKMLRTRDINQECFFMYSVEKDGKDKKIIFDNKGRKAMTSEITILDEINLQIRHLDEYGNFQGYKKYEKIVSKNNTKLVGVWAMSPTREGDPEILKKEGMITFWEKNTGKITKDNKDLRHCCYITEYFSKSGLKLYVFQRDLDDGCLEIETSFLEFIDDNTISVGRSKGGIDIYFRKIK